MADGGSLQDAMEQLRVVTDALKARRQLREANISPNRPTEDALKKLDSSMKRNTALIRKLKQLGEEGKKSILDDIAKANQSKYVSEAVAVVAEAPLKLRDIAAAVAVCSALHQRYPEFAGELVPALARTAAGSNASPSPSSGEEKPSAARRRVTLRLLVELFLAGLFTTHNILLQLMKQLNMADFVKGQEDAVLALSLVTTLAKAGREELLGLSSSMPASLPSDLAERAAEGDAESIKLADAVSEYETELAQRWVLAPEAQALFMAGVDKMFEAACAAMQTSHEALEEVERENERVLNSRGDLPESLATAYEAQRTAFETLQRGTAALAEVLEWPLPELQAAVTRMVVTDEGVVAPTESWVESLFEDEESRAFYEGLPSLREVVPAVLLGEAEKKVGAEKEDGTVEVATTGDQGGAGADAGASADKTTSSVSATEIKALDDVSASVEQALQKLAVEDASSQLEGAGAGGDEAGSRRALDAVIFRLSACVSKELCDEVAVEFCYAGGAGKGARKRLARALCDVPHGALQLLPYYSRVMAALAPLFPDVPAAVVAHLEAEFADLTKKKDATLRTLEPRLRNARYIAEMLKFRLFPPGTAFSLLKSLLDDFAGHNVDAACALVEAAGRYLSRRADTSTRLNNMLDVMVKLKNAKNLDVRQAGLVDSAYFAVRVTAQGPKIKQRPPTHEYVRHLIYGTLDASSVALVLKKLRRLKWTDDGDYVMRTLLRAARKGRASQLAPVASLASSLTKFHPWLGVAIVDSVLEEISAGLENPEAGLYQRRVAAVRFLGELYAYKLVASPIVFDTLHTLLAFAHTPDVPPEASRRLDSPQNFFRIRLVCCLLESCGSFFARGAPRKRLEDFLPFFQRYIMSKPPLPLDVDLDLQELCSKLHLTLPKYESYEAACAAVDEIEAKAKAARAAATATGLQAIDEEVEEEEGEEEEEEGQEEGAEGREREGEDIDGGSGSDSEEEGSISEAGEGSSSEGSDSDTDSDQGDSSSSEDDDSEEEESENEDQDLSDDDEDYNMGRERTAQRTEAEEQFDRDLAAAMGDTGRATASAPMLRAGGIGSMTGPMSYGAAGTAAGASPGGSGRVHGSRGSRGIPAKESEEVIGLRVMTRRGGRDDRSRELQIPVPLAVAQQLRDKEAADAAERAEVKRMVLASNRRDDLEAEAELMASLGVGGRGGGRGSGPKARGYYSRGGGRGGGGGGGSRPG